MKLLKSFSTNTKATAAVEFALGAPMLAIVVLGIASSWSVGKQVLEMRNAVKVGSTYFIQGGADLDSAKSAVTAAWEHRPDGATVNVTRECVCGSDTFSCTQICTVTSSTPNMSIRIKATSAAQAPILGFLYTTIPTITQEEVVRVR
jgi:Flp pilus assembly protein TadG